MEIVEKPVFHHDAITSRYVLSLVLIALLSTISYLTSAWMIGENEKSDAIINLSGRQRMLTHRIALFSLRLTESQSADKREKWRSILGGTVDLLENSHNALIAENEEVGIQTEHSRKIKEMFFHSPIDLDKKIRNFILKTRSLLQAKVSMLNKDNPDLKYLLDSAPFELLPALDDIVQEHEKASGIETNRLRNAERAMLGLILLTLLSAGLLIFRPIVKKVKDETDDLIKSRENLNDLLNQTMEELRAKEEVWEKINSAVYYAIIIISDKGKVLYFNPAAEKMFGYSQKEIMGEPLDKYIIPKKYREGHINGLDNFRKTADGPAIGRTVELSALNKDGEEFPVELSISGVRIKGELRAVGIVLDITERKLAEEELRQSKERLSRVVETITEGLYIVNSEGQIVFANSAAEKIFGISRAQLYSRTYDDKKWTVKKTSGEPFRKDELPFAIIKRTKTPVHNIEVVIYHPDNKEIIVSINAAPLFDASGDFQGMVATQSDVTQKKRSEIALKESERKYRSLINDASDAILLISEDGHIVDANKKAEEMFGYRREQLLAKLFSQMVPPENKKEQEMTFARLVKYKKPVTLNDTVMVRKDGGKTPLDISGSVVEYSGKRFVQGIFRDITDRKLAEEAIREANRDNELLIASIPSIIIVLDLDRRVTKWNKAAEDIFDINADKALGKAFREIGIAWDWDAVVEQVQLSMEKGQTTRLDDFSYTGLNDKEGYLSLSIIPIFGEDQAFDGLLLLGIDITQRKILEGQLSQAQKLESIGQLAAGIAHEINTPTQFVGDNIHFLDGAFKDIQILLDKYFNLLEDYKNNEISTEAIKDIESTIEEADIDFITKEAPKAIESSLKGIERVSAIVKAMKDFSHPGSKEKSLIDINRAINSTIAISKNEWKYVSEVKTDFDKSMGLVPCFPDEFNQVILNLITNAAHAIGDLIDENSDEKGIIKVQTRRENNHAVITVSDNGSGIPDGIKNKVFDHFFTTKQVGKGTGQGLSISYSIIVEKHGGTMFFTSEKGKGTTFIIHLPLANEQ